MVGVYTPEGVFDMLPGDLEFMVHIELERVMSMEDGHIASQDFYSCYTEHQFTSPLSLLTFLSDLYLGDVFSRFQVAISWENVGKKHRW